MHAPITDVFANGRSQRSFSIAARDSAARKESVREVAAALRIADVVPFKYLVVHLGVPVAQGPGPDDLSQLRAVPSVSRDDNHREAAIRSVEEIHGLAEAPGVKEIIERSFEGADLGICMDVGHAHLLGDVPEAVETCSEYLVTTHIHDNRRQGDDHLVPFQGSIDWAATVMAFEKIGYDGVLMYEVRNAESPTAILGKAASARKRLEGLMLDASQLTAFETE